jgi:hypothetical protein
MTHILILYELTLAEQYFKAIVGRQSKITQAMLELEKLSRQEDKMVSAVTLGATTEIMKYLQDAMQSVFFLIHPLWIWFNLG